MREFAFTREYGFGSDAEQAYRIDPKNVNALGASRSVGVCLLWIIILISPDVADMSRRRQCCNANMTGTSFEA